MAKIHLHIGTEKTGTKTIQRFLDLNSINLRKQNIYVPDFLGWANRKITVAAFNNESLDDYFITVGALDKKSKDEVIQECRKELNFRTSIAGERDWIVSSEFMQARLVNIDQLIALKVLLNESFSEIKIVLYIRNPLEAAISLWSTGVQSGLPWSQLPSPAEVATAFDHKKTIQRWTAVFGDNLIVKLFDKDEFVERSLLKDFCIAASIEWDDSFIVPEPENESMSHLAIMVLSKINRNLPYIVNGSINRSRGNIADLVREHFRAYPKFVATADQIASYNGYYQKSNDWVRENYFNHKDRLFKESRSIVPGYQLQIPLDDVLSSYGDLVSRVLSSADHKII